MPSVVSALADWLPDAPTFGITGNPVAKGTYPRTDGSDGPLQGPVVLSNALASQCRGAIAGKDNTGTSWVFAGTATKLYVQNGLSWTDRSGATYAVPTGGHWRFCQFGERILATNYADEVQTHTLGSGANFANLNTAAPLAKYIATIEPGFVMLGFYNDSTVQSGGLWWSGINDATSWPTPGTAAALAAQSDNQQLPNGGAITGILPAIGGSSGAVFMERAIYRIQYVGSPSIFAFTEVDRSRGCIAPQSLVQVGALAYFLSEDGFCLFDGTAVRSIGVGKVDQFFLADVDQTALERIYGTVDYARKLVIWAYPSTGATSQIPNRWIIYSYATDRWRWCDDVSIACHYMFPARTPGYTLDTLDTVLPGGVDASGITVDSSLYQGGVRLLAGFDTSHRLVSYSGSNLAARVETADFDFEGARVYVSGIRPLIDTASVTAGLGYRNDLASAINYSTPTAPGVDKRCPQRASGLYQRAVINVTAGATWSKLQGARAWYDEDGDR